AVERKAGRIGADALPSLHLALIAFFRDLLVELDRRQSMNHVGRVGLHLRQRRRLIEAPPVHLLPFTKAGDDADAGDPSFSRRSLPRRTFPSRVSHGSASPSETQ